MSERFQVDLAGMVDLLSRHLYSGPQVYIRELIQNAVDALAARREADASFTQQVAWKPRVRIETGRTEQGRMTLSVTDNGSGLTRDQARELLATIGRSSKRDPLMGQGRADYIGQFGIGLLAAFMVADSIDVYSHGISQGAAPIHWQGRADGTFTLEEISAAEVQLGQEHGTRVVLTARAEADHWFETETVIQLARDYAGLLQEDVAIRTQVGQEDTWLRLTEPDLPWQRSYRHDDAREAALLAYGQRLFGFKPLGSITLDIPLLGISGVAYILPQAVAPGSGRHRVYSKRMLVGSRISSILPDWAFFVRAVINADGLTPTASREDLHDDELLWEVREQLGRQLKEWMLRTLAISTPLTRDFITAHHLALRAVAVGDSEILDLVGRVLPYETTNGTMTLEEAIDPDSHELLYTATTEAYGRIRSVARSQGLTVVNAGYVYDAQIMEALSARPHWNVRQIESGDIVSLLELPSADRLNSLTPVLRDAEEILGQARCAVVLRRFQPDDLPAIVLAGEDARHKRRLREESEAAPDLWGGLLASLDAQVDEPEVTLVLNDACPVIDTLLRAHGQAIFPSALSSIYLSAVMLSGERIGGQAARSLGQGLAELIEAALGGHESQHSD